MFSRKIELGKAPLGYMYGLYLPTPLLPRDTPRLVLKKPFANECALGIESSWTFLVRETVVLT